MSQHHQHACHLGSGHHCVCSAATSAVLSAYAENTVSIPHVALSWLRIAMFPSQPLPDVAAVHAAEPAWHEQWQVRLLCHHPARITTVSELQGKLGCCYLHSPVCIQGAHQVCDSSACIRHSVGSAELTC